MDIISDDARKYLEAAIRLHQENGIIPTFDEIAAAVSRTRRAAIYQFEKLQRMGYVTWSEGKASNWSSSTDIAVSPAP